jgi:endogenous inhibitor of DNA gyrase (YacG/DUF329 family)
MDHDQPTTAFCPRCGKPMLISPQHTYTTVACPHCGASLEPWRITAAAHEAPTMPYPPRVPEYAVQASVYSWRNRWVAGVLAIFFGLFGVHRFYLGYTGIGILQIIVTGFTLGTVTSIWALIEGILCFCGAMTDAEGRPLRG